MSLRASALFWLASTSAPTAVAQIPPPPTPAPATIAPRPIDDFAKLPFMEDPELSPDGKRIAAKLAVNGTQRLALIPLFEKTPPVLIGLGELDLRSWQWVNDQWLAITVGTEDRSLAEPIYITRIAGVSADGKTIKPIAFRDGGQNANIIWTASDGTPRILMSMQKSVFEGADFWPEVSDVDVSTGRKRVVVAGSAGVFSWYADPVGNVRMGLGISNEGRSRRLLYRAGGEGLFKTIDRADLRKDDTLTFPILLKDRILTISDKSGHDALYDLDMAALIPGTRVWGIDGYDIDGVLRNPRAGTLDGVIYTSDRARVHWFDPAIAKMQADIDKAVAPQAATIASMSADRRAFIVHVGAGDRPGSYYFYDVAKGAMSRFSFVNDRIRNVQLAPVTSFRYKARDGLAIEAFLTLPKGREAKALPLILMPHGGPAARDDASWDWWSQFLADRGYAVVKPNFRGSTGYGTSFLRAGEGQWGLKMQDDLNDAVDDLVKRGIVDPKRVCIVGASYGGYAAMRGAQRDGARFRCAVSYAGVSDLPAMLRYDSRFLNAGASADWVRRQAPDLRAVSPVNFGAEFSAPILLVHGKKDRRVPVAQTNKLANVLKSAGKPYGLLIQPEGDHFFSREEDRRTFLEALEAFLKTHNPA